MASASAELLFWRNGSQKGKYIYINYHRLEFKSLCSLFVRFLFEFYLLQLTISREAPVETLQIDMADIFSSGSMEKLSFILNSSIVLVHFLFFQHVILIKMRILYSFNFLDIHCTYSGLKLVHNISVLWGVCG